MFVIFRGQPIAWHSFLNLDHLHVFKERVIHIVHNIVMHIFLTRKNLGPFSPIVVTMRSVNL